MASSESLEGRMTWGTEGNNRLLIADWLIITHYHIFQSPEVLKLGMQLGMCLRVFPDWETSQPRACAIPRRSTYLRVSSPSPASPFPAELPGTAAPFRPGPGGFVRSGVGRPVPDMCCSTFRPTWHVFRAAPRFLALPCRQRTPRWPRRGLLALGCPSERLGAFSGWLRAFC